MWCPVLLESAESLGLGIWPGPLPQDPRSCQRAAETPSPEHPSPPSCPPAAECARCLPEQRKELQAHLPAQAKAYQVALSLVPHSPSAPFISLLISVRLSSHRHQSFPAPTGSRLEIPKGGSWLGHRARPAYIGSVRGLYRTSESPPLWNRCPICSPHRGTPVHLSFCPFFSSSPHSPHFGLLFSPHLLSRLPHPLSLGHSPPLQPWHPCHRPSPRVPACPKSSLHL